MKRERDKHKKKNSKIEERTNVKNTHKKYKWKIKAQKMKHGKTNKLKNTKNK